METPATFTIGVIIVHFKNLLGGFLLWGRAFFIYGKEVNAKEKRLFLSMPTAWLRCHGVPSVLGGNSVLKLPPLSCKRLTFCLICYTICCIQYPFFPLSYPTYSVSYIVKGACACETLDDIAPLYIIMSAENGTEGRKEKHMDLFAMKRAKEEYSETLHLNIPCTATDNKQAYGLLIINEFLHLLGVITEDNYSTLYALISDSDVFTEF